MLALPGVAIDKVVAAGGEETRRRGAGLYPKHLSKDDSRLVPKQGREAGDEGRAFALSQAGLCPKEAERALP